MYPDAKPLSCVAITAAGDCASEQIQSMTELIARHCLAISSMRARYFPTSCTDVQRGRDQSLLERVIVSSSTSGAGAPWSGKCQVPKTMQNFAADRILAPCVRIRTQAPRILIHRRMQTFELIVIGSGRRGQRAAIQAAKSGKHIGVGGEGGARGRRVHSTPDTIPADHARSSDASVRPTTIRT